MKTKLVHVWLPSDRIVFLCTEVRAARDLDRRARQSGGREADGRTFNRSVVDLRFLSFLQFDDLTPEQRAQAGRTPFAILDVVRGGDRDRAVPQELFRCH
jgi:hypothetical protein